MIVFDLIGQILSDLVSLVGGLIQLGGLLIGVIFFSIIIYIIIIRPILGSFFDKGKRLYWINVVVLLLFGLFIGPFMAVEIAEMYPKYGVFIGMALYTLFVWLIAKPGLKKEDEMNNENM